MPRNQSLFDQLDDLFENLPSTLDDTDNDINTSTDRLSIKSADTESTSVYSSPSPRRTKSTHSMKHDHGKFSTQIKSSKCATENLLLVMDCLHDMLIQENDQIESALNDLVNEISQSKPMNTYNVPVTIHPYAHRRAN